MFTTVEQLIELANEQQVPISEIMIQQECEVTERSREDVMNQMRSNLKVMEAAVERGLLGVKSYSGLTGGDALLIQQYRNRGRTLSGSHIMKSVAYAIATNEVNAAMGTICANPTAGSAGTVPGVLFSLKERLDLSEDQMLRFLFTAGAFGLIVGNNASISGADGGCQAEVGTGSAMAAAAAVEIGGGTPEQSAHALAIAFKNLLGLVCDPVAGLVEIPCIKRNAVGASNALVAADMALAGVKSQIPADEVIEAMYRIGKTMPMSLKETAEGGLADTPTGRKLMEQVFGKK